VQTLSHDLITGLASRNAFETRLTSILDNLKPPHGIAVLFIDIDSFNSINEFLGHDAGDELSRLIAGHLLTLNIPATNIARFGPKFAIILEYVTCIEDVTRCIQTINSLVNTEITINEHKFITYLNYGISLYPEDGTSVTTLLNSASIALSAAKNIGGGTVQFCTPELHAQTRQRIAIERDLRTALAKNEFILHYQPIVEIGTKHIVGFEALLRWQKDNKLISPAEFIPIAEKTRLIIPIGEWVINTACAQAAIWQTELQRDIFVSVNVSPIQFKNSEVLETLTAALKSTQLKVECLKLEVTESTLMESEQKNITMLQAIQDMGIKIAIDDFGTGYSSLSYLRFLPIDYLKIDQSFVRHVTVDVDADVIVKAIIDLAHNLGYKVIAEGVETNEQLQFLTGLGCDYAQGYLFSKPLPVAEANALLNKTMPRNILRPS